MKQIYFCSLFLILIFLTIAPLKAQMVEDDLGRNFIYASPFHFFGGNTYVGLERFNQSYQRSFALNIGLISKADFERTRGIMVQPEVRKYYLTNYLKNDTAGINWKLKGVYAGFFIHYNYLQDDYRTELFDPTTGIFYYDYINTQYQTYGLGTTIGLIATLYKWMYLNFYIGGGIKFTEITDPNPTNNSQENPSITSPAYEGIFPRIGAQLGINF